MPHSEAASPMLQQQQQQQQQREDKRQPQAAGPEPGQAVSPSEYLGLAQHVHPTPKSVSIDACAQTISPLILGQHKPSEDLPLPWEAARSPAKPFVRSPKSRRLSGKRSLTSSPSLRPLSSSAAAAAAATAAVSVERAAADAAVERNGKGDVDHPDGSAQVDALIDQVSTWIRDERAKRSRRKAARAAAQHGCPAADHVHPLDADGDDDDGDDEARPRRRRGSDSSEASVDLEDLERILKQNVGFRRSSLRRGSLVLRSKPSVRRLRRKQSTASESEFPEDEFLVPACDAILDNSRTLAYTGGAASDASDDSAGEDLQRIPSYRDADAWARFKFEIVRLAHTLRLKGWRRVALERSASIDVQRLSGALTNAVYVVSPPADLPVPGEDGQGNILVPPAAAAAVAARPPPKVLLRIYGPQVEHLIDRDSELAVLRRLARKRIGPRLLGTFTNGRFEEFLHAKPLTTQDLQNPSTSQQIAKRMRELHDGIDLLDRERDDGAFVWRNWDKWLGRVERIVRWMDEQVCMLRTDEKPTGARAWLRRGHICGVPWDRFRDVVDRYRVWLREQCGGDESLRERLVFAHNDTQYGNILRLIPTGASPLLLPANTHKQLVVIDFEYANANTRGLEFANHFTEWCYNYHDVRKPHAFHASCYPTPENQERFIRAYVRHRPQFQAETPRVTPLSTPNVTATDSVSPDPAARRPTTTISDFMLDARKPLPQQPPTPAGREDAASLQAAQAAEDAEVSRLLHETSLWRLANTAQWIAWGLVQAKVPGMPDFGEPNSAASDPAPEDVDTDPEDLLDARGAAEYKARAQLEDTAEEEEFDYLGYAQHRAMFFWGDAVRLGFVRMEDLPEAWRVRVKHVPY